MVKKSSWGFSCEQVKLGITDSNVIKSRTDEKFCLKKMKGKTKKDRHSFSLLLEFGMEVDLNCILDKYIFRPLVPHNLEGVLRMATLDF